MSRPDGLSEASDEELVAAYVDGDEQAFESLTQRYSHRVFGICYRYFGNAADAEDAAQDAFVALLRRASTFRGTSTFATWMYRVTTNACNDLARKRARRPQAAHTEVERLAEELAGDQALEDQVAARGLDPALVDALRALDSDSREAIVLHDVYGIGYAELAERSGVAVGTVKSRIHRGHARLAQALQHAGTTARAREPSDRPRPPTIDP